MSRDWDTVKAAFARANELDDEARQQFLVDFGQEHPTLLRKLQELLSADIDDQRIQDKIAKTAKSLAEDADDPWVGRTIGVWQLERRIGEGGMGAVFLAKRADEAFEQTAALKLMTSRVLGRESITRFRAERQFLAKLSHPNIAQLLDGGSTQDDQPYLVMEYIDGVSIDRYCDDNRLSIRDRLRLFEKVCDTVDYAHRNLIVHRDLKPGNILVDSRGEPKLLDFGIAKLLDTQEVDQTMAVTREGRLMLTPEYASPEQVRGEPPTVAADVYALGVLLYRLLTGYSPYGVTRLSGIELEKAIVSIAPLRPSTVVTTDAKSDPAATSPDSLSAQRRTSPDRLRKRLSGDLDNIVLMALQKEPSRRYASAARFREDIHNYLSDRPVTARPESVAYRTGKFMKRNWLGVTVAAVFALTITALTTFYTIRLADERDTARLEAARAESVTDFLTGLFEEASPSKNLGKPKNARELLDDGAEKITEQLGDQPELRAALTRTIANTYINMRENKAARDFIEPLMEEFRTEFGEGDIRYLRLEREFGDATLNTGDRLKARTILERNYDGWLAVTAPGDYHRGIAEQRLGAVYSKINEPELATKHLVNAIEVLRNYANDDPLSLTNTMMQYGVVLRSQNQFDEEEALLTEALAIQEACCGIEQTGYSGLLNNLGNNFNARGLHEKAEAEYRKVAELNKVLYGEEGVGYANALMNLSNTAIRMGRPQESLDLQMRVRDIYGRGYGIDSVPYAYTSENIGNALMELQRYDEAEVAFQTAMKILADRFGEDDPEFAITQNNYANMLMRAGRNDEGMPQLISSRNTFLEAYGPENQSVISADVKIANGLLNMERPDEAHEYALAAVEAAKVVWSEPGNETIQALTTLGRTHRDREEYALSFAAHREAIEMAKQMEGAGLYPVVTAEYDLGIALKAAGRLDEARSLLEPRLTETAELDDSWDGLREKIGALLEGE
ncbi:MAG: serine/threonine-protein kinase [Pseudomonadota bacterium]